MEQSTLTPPVETPAAVTPPASQPVNRIEAKRQPGDGASLTEGQTESVIKAMREGAVAETNRQSAILKLCDGKHPEIQAKAIGEGWTTEKCELEVLRASRTNAAPMVFVTSGPKLEGSVIEAALARSAGMSDEARERHYGDKTLEAADHKSFRGMTLSHLYHFNIQAAGMYARPGALDNETIRTAYEADRKIKASAGDMSTLSLTGVLSNLMNKFLLDAYNAVDSVAAKICSQSDANDFKLINRYRVTAVGMFEPVGSDGELKQKQMTDETYTNQVSTVGGILGVSRQMQINDDLGSFGQIPQLIGRQARLKVEYDVFKLLLSNPNVTNVNGTNAFFSAANLNYQSGGSTALSITSMTNAEVLLLDQVDSDGKPILVTGRYVLVPTTLKTTAQTIYKAPEIVQINSSSPSPNTNPHAGKYEVLSSPYLNAQSLSGSSTTGWYLWADPKDIPVIDIAYLRGARQPVLEVREGDFDTLGLKWRGYFDYGVALQDWRGAVFSAGA